MPAQLSLRLEDDLAQWLEAEAARLADLAGVKVTRTDVALKALRTYRKQAEATVNAPVPVAATPDAYARFEAVAAPVAPEPVDEPQRRGPGRPKGSTNRPRDAKGRMLANPNKGK